MAAVSSVLFSYSVLHTGESKSHHRLEWSYANDLSCIRSWTSGDNLFGYGTTTFDLKAKDTHGEDRLQKFWKVFKGSLGKRRIPFQEAFTLKV